MGPSLASVRESSRCLISSARRTRAPIVGATSRARHQRLLALQETVEPSQGGHLQLLRVFVPSLGDQEAESVVRAVFAIVVLFYMHLKYDHKLFKALFTGPLIIAGCTALALLALFSHLAIPE